MADDKIRVSGMHVSRRDVLRGAGAAALLGSALPASAQETEAKAPEGLVRRGPGASSVAFKLNGEQATVKVEPRVTLLDALRDRLDLTGSKRICDRGACGGCTVWVNGRTVNSCTMLAVDAAGAEVTTIEGLAKGGALHPVQEQFVACDALQCGFCTPGMIMSCAALLESNPKPTLDQIQDGIAGNLCRCGTYGHIFQAVQNAAKAPGGTGGGR